MNYRRLGRTNLQVSEISLGTVELGMDYGIPAQGAHRRPSGADAARLLNRALDLGVNLIDTAQAYGESEVIIGQALKSRRDEYILATKIGSLSWEGYTGAALRKRVEASITESLGALQTDIIDLLYIHNATPELIQQGEIVEIMERVRQAGHARFIGRSRRSCKPSWTLARGRSCSAYRRWTWGTWSALRPTWRRSCGRRGSRYPAASRSASEM